MDERVVIVDDDAIILKNANMTLSEAGFKVTCLKSGRLLMDYIVRNPIDILLLDIRMPEMDGFETISALRAWEKDNSRDPVPVIFLTARDENDDVIMGFRSGGDDYIIKPYDLNVLKARIEAQLRRNVGRSPQHPKIELPYLTVDLFEGSATLDGTECSLPQRELQILYMLASKLGERISYRDIYKNIYGCNVEDSKNTIRVNISRLKKHLGMDDMSTYEIAATSDGEYVLRRVIF